MTHRGAGGSAVMYQPGKVLKAGSSAYVGVDTAPAVNDAHVLDATAAEPRWRAVGSIAFPRAHHNLTILPDGDVLVTGGMRTPTHHQLSANAHLVCQQLRCPDA